MVHQLQWLIRTLILLTFSFFWNDSSIFAQFSFQYSGAETLYVGDDCTVPYTFDETDVTVTSSSGGAVDWSISYDLAGINQGDLVSAGDIVTMFVPVSDDLGNADTFSFDIAIVDTIAPVFDDATLPASVVNSTSVENIPLPANPTATDNCSTVVIDYEQTNLQDTCSGGTFYRMWTATDVYGNTQVFIQTIIVGEDDSGPQFVVWPTNTVSGCEVFDSEYPSWLAQTMNTIQAVDPTGVTYSNNASSSISFDCDTNFVVTFVATDGCGNTTPAPANFIAVDTTAPIVLNLPTNLVTSCDNIPDAIHLGAGLDMDDCDANLVEEFSESSTKNSNPQSCNYSSYTIVRDWTIRDHCDNQLSFQQVITVEDTIGPVFQVGAPVEVSVACHQIPLFGDLIAGDNCGSEVSITKNESIQIVGCSEEYDLIRTWTATDACGNESSLLQTIHVSDTLAPVISTVVENVTVGCGDIPNSPTIIAIDSCDYNVTIIPNESSTQSTDSTSCEFYNYTIVRTWVAIDNCGNVDQTSQVITVEDQDAPIVVCPDNLVMSNDSLQCGANVLVPALASAFDKCTARIDTTIITNMANITHPDSIDPSGYPVSVVLHLELPNASQVISGNIKLQVDLVQVDGEGASAFFYVYAEDSTLIGQTNLIAEQCGNSTTVFTNLSISDVSSWSADGTMDLFLVSAGQGASGINDVCADGHIEASLSYEYATQIVPLDEAVLLDGVLLENMNLFLGVGQHTITYKATDCSNHSSSCSITIDVKDTELPIIVCPTDTTTYTGENNCLSLVEMTAPSLIIDNCGIKDVFLYESDSVPIFFVDNVNVGIVPSSIFLKVPNVWANALTDGFLEISFLGDNADIGEELRIFGESNYYLGKTINGPESQECSMASTTSIVIPKDSLNAWCADGLLIFHLNPSVDVGNTDFINPCGNSTTGFDSISFVQLKLTYTQSQVVYTMQDALAGWSSNITSSFAPGTYTVDYQLKDVSDNVGTCSWQIQVLDTIAPKAQALSTMVTVNPSGTMSIPIDPNVVDSGSSDNCEIVSMSLTPETFSCDQAGSILPIILTVTDASGNEGKDTAFVQVVNEPPEPVFTQGVCGNDTLFLFANPPESNGNVYSYSWSGPNGFVSQLPNPMIASPNDSQVGSYSVTITGFTGCVSSNTVQVQLNALPSPPFLTTNTSGVCPGEEAILSTQGFAGSTVTYSWYEGLPPNGDLLGTTTTNAYVLSNTGNYGLLDFYVEVNINGCVSSSSNVISIAFTPNTDLTVVSDVVNVCTGDKVLLEIINSQDGVNYQWVGPNQFSSPNANDFFLSSSSMESGSYVITATQNGCILGRDTIIVNIADLPEMPIVASIPPVCEGDSIPLEVVNYSSGNLVTWYAPSGAFATTIGASFLWPNSLDNDGTWTVQIDNGECVVQSDFVIDVNQIPVVEIDTPNVVCLGDELDLVFTSEPAAATQLWTGPNNFSSPLSSPSVMVVNGTYVVTAKTSAGCFSSDTIDIAPVISPEITALSNTGDGCYDGEAIQLVPTVFPLDMDTTYEYHWTGPGNFELCCGVAAPYILNASTSVLGYYNLVVTNEYGCISEQVSTLVEGVAKPATPILESSSLSICEENTLSLKIANSSDYSNNSGVVWISPSTTLTSTSFNYQNTNMASWDNGYYSAIVSEEGCVSDTSSALYITVKPKPEKPSISSNSPVCKGDSLKFWTGMMGGQYHWVHWMSLEDSIASVFNPVVAPVSATDGGTYFVQVSLDGCLSEVSDSIEVVIKALPTKPILEYQSPVCSVGGVISLSVTEETKVNQGLYTWIGTDTIAAASYFTEFESSEMDQFQLGNNSIYVTVNHGGCTNSSDPVTIEVSEIPTGNANAGNDFSTCIGEQFFLKAQEPSIGTGQWSQVFGSNTTIVAPDSTMTTVANIDEAGQFCFAWALTSSGCAGYSIDTVCVDISSDAPADAGTFIDTCSDVTILYLDASPANGKWSQPFSQANLGVKIKETFNAQSEVSGLESGRRYLFYWAINNGCGASKDSVSIRVSGIPNAGINQVLCGTVDCAKLEAIGLSETDAGKWTVLNSSQVTLPNQDSTTACSLETGRNAFIWTINGGNCGDQSRDTVIIDLKTIPIAANDSFDLEVGLQLIDVQGNDDCDDCDLEVTVPPQYATILGIENGQIKIEPKLNYIGVDQFEYQVCLENCGECSNATVFLQIGGLEDCRVPTLFTPDQDGINDYLVIPCLFASEHKECTLSIYNPWGDEIYHSVNYQNDWDGVYRGAPIQEGTYYYIFDLGDGQPAKRGFFHLKY